MREKSLRTICLLGLIFLLIAVPFAKKSSAETLDLQQAIAAALAHNRNIESASLEVEKTGEQVKAVRTRFFPQFSLSVLGSGLLTSVDFTFEQGVFGTYPGIGPIPGEKTSISTPRQLTGLVVGSVQQPLTQLYKIKLNSDLAKASGEEAKEAQRSARQSIVNQVKKLYYGILESQSATAYAAESIKLYQELDRVTSDYVLQEVALKSDGLQVKAKLASAEYDAMIARNELATRKEQLNLLMGRDVRTEFEVEPVPDETAFEHDILVAQQQALQSNPEIQKARTQLKQASYDKRIKKAEYIPDVSLSVSYIAPLHYDFVPSVIASYGIYFSWDIYDWGRKAHELVEKQRTVRQAELAVMELENKILIDVSSQYRKVQESRKLISVTKLAVEAAREYERILTNKYKEHSALLKDVAQAHTSLEESRDQSQKALLAFWAARADFEQTLGEEP